MATIVLQTLKIYDLDITNCREQTHDHTSNMSGAYSGLQARIKEMNALAVFVPCSAHSLNLVGSYAAVCCETAVSFFSNLQALIQFFFDLHTYTESFSFETEAKFNSFKNFKNLLIYTHIFIL